MGIAGPFTSSRTSEVKAISNAHTTPEGYYYPDDLYTNATKYLGNGFFVAKLVLIAVAGVNMLIFHFVSARDQPRWDNRARPPLSARLAGGISLLLWIAVVVCGRWIGFTMSVG